MKKILITDSLFIFSEHEEKLRDAGFEISRLDKPQATEQELIEALKGKEGYILGGIEKLTDKIIDSANKLEAIVFTGIGYKDFIPNYEYVSSKKIAIANTPDGPSHSVAEWAVSVAVAMNRNIFDLGRGGNKTFMTSTGIEGQQIGIIGLGRIGREIVQMINAFKPSSISYCSKHRHQDYEEELGIDYNNLESILAENDIIFVCVPKDAGENMIGKRELALMKDNALIISSSVETIIDKDALIEELTKGRIRAGLDYSISNDQIKDLSLNTFYSSNTQTAFNTTSGLKRVSDMATESIINLLETGTDKNKVN